MRTAAADGLREYKKDVGVCASLLRHARTEKGTEQEVLDLRKRCLRSYGAIAPFAKSVDLEILFSDPDPIIGREAVEAVEMIKSVRMLPRLLALFGELERIRDDDGKDPGPEVPGGPPKQGDNNSRRKRKEVMLDPTGRRSTRSGARSIPRRPSRTAPRRTARWGKARRDQEDPGREDAQDAKP